MSVQEDEIPREGLGQHEHDVLAERRARRMEMPPDPILIRRAETAEAAAEALEEHLNGIQARLQQAEEECTRASQRLGEREEELRVASERLAKGERDLRAVTGRLVEREDDVRLVSQRLGQREEELRVLTERLSVREQELRRAELEIKGRLEGLEARVADVQNELEAEREGRLRAEQELERVRAALARTEALVGELRDVAARLRAAMAQVGASVAQRSEGEDRREEASRVQMAEALATAVERLRARVAAVGELDEQTAPAAPEVAQGAPVEASAEATQGASGKVPAEAAQGVPGEALAEAQAQATQGGPADAPAEAARGVPAEATQGVAAADSGWTEYVPAAGVGAETRSPWLAQAIRGVAGRRDARLAAELVLEMLPAQAQVVAGRVRYAARIAEIGEYEVSILDGRAAVTAGDVGTVRSPDFVLEGPSSAFAELAAGGVGRSGGGRRPQGLRVRRGRLRARRLLAARREPVTLADFAKAGISIWPGLLLLALAEAVDPAWTASESFLVAFTIEGQESATLYVRACDGEPVRVSRAGEGEQQADVSVKLGERAFMALVAGVPLPDGEEILLKGDREALERLLGWTDRAQGVRRHGA